ncbi:MAG: hypothetical protein ACREBS_08665 [Nitrososphaerales archaeon]
MGFLALSAGSGLGAALITSASSTGLDTITLGAELLSGNWLPVAQSILAVIADSISTVISSLSVLEEIYFAAELITDAATGFAATVGLAIGSIIVTWGAIYEQAQAAYNQAYPS